MGRHLILYDGVCGLCNRMNQFVLAHDHAGGFDFAAQQSDTGRRLLVQAGADPDALTTLFVIADYRGAAPALLSRSRAVFFIAKHLGGIWRLAGLFSILPDGVVDRGYDFVARRRYRWFGQHDTCPLPTPDTRRRFIDV